MVMSQCFKIYFPVFSDFLQGFYQCSFRSTAKATSTQEIRKEQKKKVKIKAAIIYNNVVTLNQIFCTNIPVLLEFPHIKKHLLKIH